MKQLNKYLSKYSPMELQYYLNQGIDKSGWLLKTKLLLKDLDTGLTTLDEIKDELLPLLKEQQKKELYQEIMDGLDPFGPDEYQTDLLDLLDPDNKW